MDWSHLRGSGLLGNREDQSQAALVGASSRGREVPSQTAGGSHTLPYPPTPITTPGSPSSPWPQWLSPSCLYRPMTSISLPLMLIVCLLMIDPMRPWTSSQSPVPSRVRAGHGVVTMLLLGTSFQPPIRGFLPLALPSPPPPPIPPPACRSAAPELGPAQQHILNPCYMRLYV